MNTLAQRALLPSTLNYIIHSYFLAIPNELFFEPHLQLLFVFLRELLL